MTTRPKTDRPRTDRPRTDPRTRDRGPDPGPDPTTTRPAGSTGSGTGERSASRGRAVKPSNRQDALIRRPVTGYRPLRAPTDRKPAAVVGRAVGLKPSTRQDAGDSGGTTGDGRAALQVSLDYNLISMRQSVQHHSPSLAYGRAVL